MITKEQALEFIDELSKNHKIFMDLEHGKFYVDTWITIEEEILGDYGFEKGGFLPLETAVWLFIKENINTDLVKEFAKIPVDIDMLEVGQTYEIEYDNYGEIDKIVDKLTKITIDEYRNNCRTLHFDKHCSITEGLILEMYKVNE